jgi:hypothetical protein
MVIALADARDYSDLGKIGADIMTGESADGKRLYPWRPPLSLKTLRKL